MYVFSLGLVEEATCRFCLEDEETPEHILHEWEKLSRLRILTFAGTHPSSNSYTAEYLSYLISLLRKVGLDRVLEPMDTEQQQSFTGFTGQGHKSSHFTYSNLNDTFNVDYLLLFNNNSIQR